MPRSRSSGNSVRSAPRATSERNRPKPVDNAPSATPAQGGSGGSFVRTIVEGMVFGTGSAMARRIFNSVLGPRTIQHETVVSEASTANSFAADACDDTSKAFEDCLHSYGIEVGKCQFYMDTLAECRKNSDPTLSAK